MLLLKIFHLKDRLYYYQLHGQSMCSKIVTIESKYLTHLISNILNYLIRSVRDLARLSLKDPLYISVHEHSVHTTPESLQQSYIVYALEDKLEMLWSFIRKHLKQKIIVFFSSCKQVPQNYS